ncbi:MAG: flavin prenyltransferase UbiX [Candidatus Sumerlaeia bacterium]|nr:flavin prenyltransferase UbiX [Candidatus Sumerlaeia bacterium]
MTNPEPLKNVVVGLSGASGTIYGIRLLQYLVRMEWTVHLLVSSSTWKVMASEMELPGISPSTPIHEWLGLNEAECKRYIHTYNIRDIAAPMASGTFRSHGMVVVPASMKTIAALAHGYSDNLLTRCADCFLKERRKLILVPREAPLSTIHLRNLTTLSECGAHILPAMPGFYHNPKTLDDLVDFMVMKILDSMDIPHPLEKYHWQGPKHIESPSE